MLINHLRKLSPEPKKKAVTIIEYQDQIQSKFQQIDQNPNKPLIGMLKKPESNLRYKTPQPLRIKPHPTSGALLRPVAVTFGQQPLYLSEAQKRTMEKLPLKPKNQNVIQTSDGSKPFTIMGAENPYT
jgi:hypothetical protein